MMENLNDGYYHFLSDLQKYPDAWCYIVWSRRGPGKTYSALWTSYYMHIPIIYMKRTLDDVELICSDNGYGFDPSPYVPINRDKGTNIKCNRIKKGFGAFYDYIDDGPDGVPVSYLMALNGIKKYKGFDFSNCDWILLDEFIPQVGEIIKHGEGEMLLDLYMTVARDRQKRGRKPLKLVLFANAEEISTPVTNTLEVVDIMADLNASGQTHYYDEERGIMLHHITNDEHPLQASEKLGIYKAMQGTAWGRKAFEGDFANNDFTNVGRISLKNMTPFIHISYKLHDYYIYIREDGMRYMCTSAAKCPLEFNLDLENDQKLYYTDYGIDLRNDCIEGRFKFQKYSMYDLIVNYKKFFKI